MQFPLVIAANRDEHHARPSAPAAFWEDAPHVLAGRDLLASGTWLGVTRAGRWAAITNVRAAAAHREGAASRGALTRDFLVGDAPVGAYAHDVASRASRYSGFNLLLGDGDDVYYVSSTTGPLALPAGDYALSNAALDTPWPKTSRLRERLAGDAIAYDEGALLDALDDRTTALDADLPDTGVGVALERFLSPVFIAGEPYGTRSSTVVRIDAGGTLTFVERTFGPLGVRTGEHRVTFPLDREPSPR